MKKNETIVIQTQHVKKRDTAFLEEKKRFPMTIEVNKKKYNRKKLKKDGFNHDHL